MKKGETDPQKQAILLKTPLLDTLYERTLPWAPAGGCRGIMPPPPRETWDYKVIIRAPKEREPNREKAWKKYALPNC